MRTKKTIGFFSGCFWLSKYTAIGIVSVVGLLACTDESSSSNASTVSPSPAVVVSTLPVSATPASQTVPTSDQTAPVSAQASTYKAGINYLELPGSLNRAAKVKVTEFFLYSCPHCFALEAYIEPWAKQEQNRIEFQQLPVYWESEGKVDPYSELLAQAFFISRSLNRAEQMHGILFNAIHRERLNLQSVEGLRSLFVREGVSAADFDKYYDTFSVKQKIQQSKTTFEKFNLNSVPSLVVADHYVTNVSMAGGHDQLLKVLSYLVTESSTETTETAK